MEQNDGGGNNAGGSGTVEYPGWMSSLPDAHKTNESFAQFKEAPQVWDKFDSLLKAEGKSIAIPDEKSTDEERAAFYNKLGRPETPDKYSITKPELPEGVPYDPAIEKVFKEFAHQKGLPDSQAKEIYNWYWNLAKDGYAKQQQAETQANEKAINQLKDEWKGDDFKVNSELAARSFKKFSGENPEAVKFVEETKINGIPLGNHPIFLKVFAAIGKAMSDDSAGGARGGGVGTMSDEDKAKTFFPNTKF
jgi:hypothetical protein